MWSLDHNIIILVADEVAQKWKHLSYKSMRKGRMICSAALRSEYNYVYFSTVKRISDTVVLYKYSCHIDSTIPPNRRNNGVWVPCRLIIWVLSVAIRNYSLSRSNYYFLCGKISQLPRSKTTEGNETSFSYLATVHGCVSKMTQSGRPGQVCAFIVYINNI